MTKGLVSVVIPSKNRPDFLVEALGSVFAQTYQNLEIIVVDDGSAFSLGPMLKEKYGDRILFLRHEKSQGAPAARNAGARLASGEYIAFLDDDDLWLPQKIEKQIAVFSANEIAGLVFCGEDIVCEGEVLRHREAVWPPDGQRQMLQANLVGGTSVVLIRQSVFRRFFFDESLPSCQDWDLFLRISQVFHFSVVPETLVRRRLHKEQISGSIDKRIRGRQIFFSKHYEYIKGDKRALSQHLRRFGSFSLLGNSKNEAQTYFFQALCAAPLDWRSWVCFSISHCFPTSLATRLLSRYAVTLAQGYSQYH